MKACWGLDQLLTDNWVRNPRAWRSLDNCISSPFIFHAKTEYFLFSHWLQAHRYQNIFVSWIRSCPSGPCINSEKSNPCRNAFERESEINHQKNIQVSKNSAKLRINTPHLQNGDEQGSAARDLLLPVGPAVVMTLDKADQLMASIPTTHVKTHSNPDIRRSPIPSSTEKPTLSQANFKSLEHEKLLKFLLNRGSVKLHILHWCNK